MIDTKDFMKFLVIPRWQTLPDSLGNRELLIAHRPTPEIDPSTRARLERDFAEFKENPSPLVASDLMGGALAGGDRELARELAKYVLSNSSTLQRPAVELAASILGQSGQPSFREERMRVKIARLKSVLAEYPHHPFGWIELARAYTILGQNERAKRAVQAALNLAPTDRYIIRSATRFFLHIGDPAAAWYYIRKAAMDRDPWISAVDVSVTWLANKPLPSVQKLIPKTVDEVFRYSELIENCSMLELASGNRRKARQLLRLAWSNPTTNVVTHADWFLRNRLSVLAPDTTSVPFEKSREATAWRRYWRKDVPAALEAVREWELEEPYSRHPYLLGSTLACTIDGFVEAREFAARGLQANPDDFLLWNNLAFALLNEGKLQEAETGLKRLSSLASGKYDMIFSRATSGLLEFKRGNMTRGRELYTESMALCTELKDPRLYAKAAIHLAIAEVEAGTPEAPEAVQLAINGSKEIEHIDVEFALRQLRRRLSSPLNNLPPLISTTLLRMLNPGSPDKKAPLL